MHTILNAIDNNESTRHCINVFSMEARGLYTPFESLISLVTIIT